jgi:predicted secreted protein
MTSNNYEGPDTNLLGASGTEVWVFGASDTGSATIKMNYGRPWEGGDKDLYTVTINVNIK